MKRIFFLFFIVLVSGAVRAQESQGYLGNYTQPAPNVASLGKYVDYPVGYWTGTPSISIPIYELHDGAIKLPISLSYHASGIRVSEVASWVGLGWNLNATGMIARTVRGGPDEGFLSDHGVMGGYYIDSGIRKFNIFPYPIGGIIPTTDYNSSDRSTFLSYASYGKTDGEPDLFTFSMGGYGGKFVFDENRIPRVLDQQDIKIAVNYSSGFQSWVITTPDGTDYYFGENNMHEVTAVAPTAGLDDVNTHVPSSWFLTKIIYPNTKDTVLFNYTPETYWYYDLGSESALFNQQNGPYNPKAACIATTAPPMSSLKTTVSGLRLTSIKTRNYTVTFIAKNIRQDVASNSSNPYPYILDSIKVFTSQNQAISQFALNHIYFKSTTQTGASVGALSGLAGDTTDVKRLKLTSVQEFSGDGTLSRPPYTVTYQETYQLPRRMSFDQDHWGYSNNPAGNHNDRFTPQVYHFICNTSGGTGITAIRDPYWPAMQAFSIKDITDPLGVKTSFEFEPHRSIVNIGSTNMIGGLRIHKIKTLDGVTGDSTVRLFDYGGGGVVYHQPNYLIELHNEYYYHDWFPVSIAYIGYDFNEFHMIRGLLRQSQSIVPLQDFQGNHIGYSSVKEIFGPNGEGGYKVHGYQADQGFSTSRLSIENYASWQTIQNAGVFGQGGVNTGYYGNGHFNDLAPQNLQYYSSYGSQYYPFAPEQVDFRRGRLMSEETYDSADNIIQSVQNVYKESFDESLWLRGFKFHRMSNTYILDGATGFSSTVDQDAYTFYKLHTGISHLMQTVTKNYKDGKTFVTTTNYAYESTFHTQKTSDSTINSQGDTLVTKTYYTADYANTATADNVFTKLKVRNMLLPVSKRVWKNGKLLSGTVTLFKDFATGAPDTIINPYKIYALETGNPLTASQAGESIKLTGLLPSILPNSYFHEKALFNYSSGNGKISEQNLTYDKKQALIWDNQLSLPLAVVDNASISDVAYNSFESADTGYWKFTAASKVTDASTPLGNKVYVLSAGNPISKTVTSGKKYIVSYWVKAGASVTISGGTINSDLAGATVNTTAAWSFHQVTITTNTTTISISGSGNIDEVRLYPATAQMVTYTYDSLFRLVDQCGANGAINQYEYDAFNRLVDIKDMFGNVVKAFEYNYGGLSR